MILRSTAFGTYAMQREEDREAMRMEVQRQVREEVGEKWEVAAFKQLKPPVVPGRKGQELMGSDAIRITLHTQATAALFVCSKQHLENVALI